MATVDKADVQLAYAMFIMTTPWTNMDLHLCRYYNVDICRISSKSQTLSDDLHSFIYFHIFDTYLQVGVLSCGKVLPKLDKSRLPN